MSFPIRGATMGRALAGLLREIRGDNIGARPSNTPRDTPIQPNISPDFSNVDPLLNDTDSTNQYANLLERNSLDDYTNTKYHIELSLVGDVTNVNTSQKALRDHDVLHFIASSDLTDASEDRELRPESEFFITKFSFKTFPSVTSRSPESVDTVMMNMHIQEPHGFSFDKAVRRAARLINSDSTNGEVNPSRLIFRVDLWFSGYTKDGEFVQKIPVTNPFPSVRGATVEIDREGVPDLDTLEGNQAQYSTQDQYTFFTSIHALDAKIDKAGTSYIAQMIEVRDVPRASEYDTFDNENVELPEGESTLEDYFNAFSRNLERHYGTTAAEPYTSPPISSELTGENVSNQSQSIQARYYHFHLPDELRNEPITEGRDEGSTNLNAGGNSIISHITSMIAKTEAGRAGIISSDGSQGPFPRYIYVVRTRIDYNGAVYNSELGDYTGINLHYYIEKSYDFRETPGNRAQLMDISNIQRTRQLIQTGALKRIYQYLFNGPNTEVFEFDVSLNMFWYKHTADPLRDPEANRSRTGYSPNEERQNYYPIVSNDAANRIAARSINSSDTSYEDLWPTRTGVNTMAFEPVEHGSPDDDDDTNAEEATMISRYYNELNQSLDVNLVSLESLRVRGDPQWLSSRLDIPGFDELNSNGENREGTRRIGMEDVYDSIRGSDDGQSYFESAFNLQLATNIIYLAITQPRQTDFMSENRNEPYVEDTNLGGFYQVTAVEHNLENGKYEQNFEGFRLFQSTASGTE